MGKHEGQRGVPFLILALRQAWDSELLQAQLTEEGETALEKIFLEKLGV